MINTIASIQVSQSISPQTSSKSLSNFLFSIQHFLFQPTYKFSVSHGISVTSPSGLQEHTYPSHPTSTFCLVFCPLHLPVLATHGSFWPCTWPLPGALQLSTEVCEVTLSHPEAAYRHLLLCTQITINLGSNPCHVVFVQHNGFLHLDWDFQTPLHTDRFLNQEPPIRPELLIPFSTSVPAVMPQVYNWERSKNQETQICQPAHWQDTTWSILYFGYHSDLMAPGRRLVHHHLCVILNLFPKWAVLQKNPNISQQKGRVLFPSLCPTQIRRISSRTQLSTAVRSLLHPQRGCSGAQRRKPAASSSPHFAALMPWWEQGRDSG